MKTLESLDTKYALLLFGIAYVLAARLGIIFVVQPEGVASIWPVSGFALGILIMAGKEDRYKYIAAIFVANTFANLWGGNTLLPSLGFAFAPMAESAMGAWTYDAISGKASDFRRMKDLAGLVVAALFINGLTAFLGAAVASIAFTAPYWETWKLWWTADGLSLLLITPFVLTWKDLHGIVEKRNILRWLEILATLVVIIILSLAVFDLIPEEYRLVKRPYWLLAVIVWSAVRFETGVVMSGILAAAMIALSSGLTGNGSSPWGATSHLEQMLHLQGYFMTTISISLIVSISMIESKRAEAAARRNEELFRVIASSTPDHLLVQDSDLRYSLVMNPQLGLTEKDMIGKTDHDFLSKEDAGRLTEIKRQVLKTGSSVQVEVPLLSAKGEREFFEGSYVPKFDETGQIDGLIGYFRNVTERKRAEQTLRESKQRYHDLFDQANEGLLIMTPDGRITEVNRAFARMHGYTLDELKQERIGDLDVLKERTLEDRADIVRRVQDGEVPRFEVEHYHKDGHIFPLNVTAKIVNIGGQIYFLAFHQDITESKQMEEEKRALQERLQRAEKMEALGQLAGRVAHDLNNVLGVSAIYLELLQEELPEGNPLRSYADNILSSNEKAAAIIQDLLSLARRGVTVSEVTNLNAIIANLLKTPEFEKLQAFYPNVTFRTHCDVELMNIKGSPAHLERTVMNLVSNAAEAISGKGEVTIRTENRYLDKPITSYDEVKQGEYVVLTVSDTGTGISAENREKIFEPFYTKKTMGRSGNGLGLSIVWGTVKDYNGYIDLQTEVGEGTTFTLYFPVTREEMIAPQQKAPIEQYMGKGESVLVVDDIAGQREIAINLLTRLGYQVHAVSGGEEAVEYLKGNKADILLLDMIMAPGIDGLETYKQVLEISPKQKAIIVSGFSETDRVKEALNLGAGAYVKKPYITEKLGVAIRDELKR